MTYDVFVWHALDWLFKSVGPMIPRGFSVLIVLGLSTLAANAQLTASDVDLIIKQAATRASGDFTREYHRRDRSRRLRARNLECRWG